MHACQKCSRPGKPVAFINVTKRTDDQGLLCDEVLCPKCGARGLIRVIHETPPCRRCGHTERSFVKGGATEPTPGVGVAPVDGAEFMRMMQSQSVPGSGE